MFGSLLRTICLCLIFWAGTASAASEELNSNLYDAVLSANTVLTQDLLKQGADPNYSESNRSVLGWAAQSGFVEVARLLLVAGANIDAVDGIGQTALMRAVDTWQIPMIQLLLASGADVDIRDSYGKTVALQATEQGRLEIAQLLIDAGANFDVVDDEGHFPALLAVQGAGEEAIGMIRMFGLAGVNLNRGDDYYTPLYYAVQQGDVALVQALLEAGASPDTKTASGAAPLTESTSNAEILKALLNAGADPDISNDWGETALFGVIENGSTDDLQLLIDAGADVNHPDTNGQTPLGRAEALHRPEMAKLLEMNSATESGEPQSSVQSQQVTAAPKEEVDNDLAALPRIQPLEILRSSGLDVTYNSSASLQAVMDFYSKELPANGWEPEEWQTDKLYYAMSKFRRNGELLSLTLTYNSGAEPPNVIVSLVPHGRLSARKQPHYPNSTVTYEDDATAVWMSDDDVALVTNETLKMLQQAGWQGQVSADSESMKVLNLTKDDSALSVMISVANQMGNPTAIQYSVLKRRD